MTNRWIAICHNTNFDGHYRKTFEVPEDIMPAPASKNASNDEKRKAYQARLDKAAWYFLNHIDFSSCVDKVYPESVFAN